MMTPTAQPASVPQIRWGEVWLFSLSGALLAGAFIMWVTWKISPSFLPAPIEPFWIHLKGCFFKFLLGDFFHFKTEFGAEYSDWLASGGAAIVIPRVLLALFASSVSFFILMLKLAKPKDVHVHVSGRRLLTDTDATSSLATQAGFECKAHGKGIKLHPSFSFFLSRDRETRHFFILGSIGGGKTQVILPLMLAAHERGDRMIVHDNKGDFTSKLAGDPIIIAPWDARSAVWDVASDCTTKQDARELAVRLVPESKDPMWSFAARQILVGFLISLQQERGTEWGWKDLAALVPLPQPDLLRLMAAYNPEGVRAVEDASKTTQSILITLSSYMSVVFDLADAWGDKPDAQRISFINWLTDENHPQRTLILQNSGRFASLSHAYISGIIAMLSSRINSPDFSDSKTRRIWFFLDEFPQLGKLENFAPLLEVGRSKGVRVVIGAQDLAQIRELYGRDAAQSWASMVGTQIFARINPGETADWISKLVGQRIVERPNLSVSGTYGGAGQNVTRSYGRESIPVLLPSQLSDELGSSGAGVKCLLLGYRNANILLWPYTTLTVLRPVSKLAGWVLTAQERKIADSNTDAPADADLSDVPAKFVPPLAIIPADNRPPVLLAINPYQEQKTTTTPATSKVDAAPLIAVAADDNTQESDTSASNSDDSPTLAAIEELIGTSSADAAAQPVTTPPAKKRIRLVRKTAAEAEQEAD